MSEGDAEFAPEFCGRQDWNFYSHLLEVLRPPRATRMKPGVADRPIVGTVSTEFPRKMPSFSARAAKLLKWE
jgi:hypothetical protein